MSIRDAANHFYETSLQNQPSDNMLLKLPGEIRNRIYEYIFPDWSIQFPSVVIRPYNALAILQSCRQIYTETQFLPYSLSTFSASKPDDLKLWLCKRTKEQCTAIRAIEFHFLFNGMGLATRHIPWWLNFPRLYEEFVDASRAAEVRTNLTMLSRTLTGLRSISLRGTAPRDFADGRYNLKGVRKSIEDLIPGL